jgi:hypothetical protein
MDLLLCDGLSLAYGLLELECEHAGTVLIVAAPET